MVAQSGKSLAADDKPDAAPQSPLTSSKRFRRPFVLVVPALIFAATVGYGTWRLQPPMYQATAVIRVAQSPETLIPSSSESHTRDSESFAIYLKTQSQLVKSQLVLKKAMHWPGVSDELPQHSDPLKWLEAHLQVNAPGDSELMEVTLWGLEPRLQPVLNAVQQSYFDEIVNVERHHQIHRLSELQRILEE